MTYCRVFLCISIGVLELLFSVHQDDRCNLYCRAYNTNSYFSLMDKVVDGTPCAPDTFDLCVNGQCRPAGCDHFLDSDMQLGKKARPLMNSSTGMSYLQNQIKQKNVGYDGENLFSVGCFCLNLQKHRYCDVTISVSFGGWCHLIFLSL